MGMFDYVIGDVKCLNCKKEFVAEEQFKFADCELNHYTEGNSIPLKDGEYSQSSYVRPTLDTQCPYCKTWQHFKFIVKNGVLEKFETTETFQINETNIL